VKSYLNYSLLFESYLNFYLEICFFRQIEVTHNAQQALAISISSWLPE